MENSAYKIDMYMTPSIYESLKGGDQVKVVKMNATESLLSRDYVDCKVYLLEGSIEVFRRNQVPQLHSDEEADLDEPIFLFSDPNEYAKCKTDCQFLVLIKDRNVTSLANIFLSDSEKEKLENNTLLEEEQVKNAGGVNRTEVANVLLLQREYAKLKQANENLSSLYRKKSLQLDEAEAGLDALSEKYNDLRDMYLGKREKYKQIKEAYRQLRTEMKMLQNMEGMELELPVQEEKENLLSKVNFHISQNVPRVKAQLMKFLQNNMSSESGFHTVEDVEQDINWHPVEETLPTENGVFYVSDGQDTVVSYYNSDKKKFYLNAQMEIRFWSEEKVTLG